jgi:eukaryotic-like serine/threonine-protein kinase
MLSQLAPGTILGQRFRLERLLGEGGMGVVWAAIDGADGERVALKLIRRGPEDRRRRRRFVREARLGAALVHPHVRHVREIVELDDGQPALVMDYLVGEPFADLLARSRPLPLPEAAELLLPVAAAVGTAHASGVIHRDLKPGNIFLVDDRPSPHVMVLDFGLAKRTRSAPVEDTGTVSRDGVLLGTPAYSSPEQVFGDADLDHRTDVWSLGIILYETLSGVLPTQASTVGQVLKRIVMEPIPPLAGAVPPLPPDICDLVDRMLSQTRSGRPKSLHEVAAVLARHAGVAVPSFGPPVRPSPCEEEEAG